jgi:hypothetical protein
MRRNRENLAGLCLRHCPDGDAETGVWLGLASRGGRDEFLKGMKAENVPASPPLDVALLPLQPYVEQKLTSHRNWPSFTTGRGPSIRYGTDCCARTVAIHGRFAGVVLDPKYTRRDVADIVEAIRKVYPATRRA